MPFKSEQQRRLMWAKHPQIARRWADKYGSLAQNELAKRKNRNPNPNSNANPTPGVPRVGGVSDNVKAVTTPPSAVTGPKTFTRTAGTFTPGQGAGLGANKANVRSKVGE